MQRICVACHQPITDEERWFRLREDYVHLFCYERYLRRISERRQQPRATPPGPVPDIEE
jgi:hypothetical protein